VIAARLVHDLATGCSWIANDGPASRRFRSPAHTGGEWGLRIHFESKRREPAIEFDLKAIYAVGQRAEADRLLSMIAGMVDTDPAPLFPSIPLSGALDRWERGARSLLLRYMRVRQRVDEGTQ
jgi:hypothetical protein